MKTLASSLLLLFLFSACNPGKAKRMEIAMPKDVKDTAAAIKVNEKLAVTLLLDGNKEGIVFYYEGILDSQTLPVACSIDSLRSYVMMRNAAIAGEMDELRSMLKAGKLTDSVFAQRQEKVRERYSKETPFFLVKWGGDAKYADVIDLLDLLKSCDVTNYSLTPVTQQELDALKKVKPE